MSEPIVVTLPHQLGKAEALRRLQGSFSNAQSSGGSLLVFKHQWSGDHLDFRAEDHVRLEVQLPWLLSLLANKAKALGEALQAQAFLTVGVMPGCTVVTEKPIISCSSLAAPTITTPCAQRVLDEIGARTTPEA